MSFTRFSGVAGISGLLLGLAGCSSSSEDRTGQGPEGTAGVKHGIGDGEDRGSGRTASPGASASYASAAPASAPAAGASADASGLTPVMTASGSGASGSGAGAPIVGSDTGAAAPAPTPAPSDVALLPLPEPRPTQVPPGTLTAGAWDDNRNLERFLGFRDALHRQQTSGLLDFSSAAHEAAQLQAEAAPHSQLDVSLVVDTTGSMGDEFSFLQTEFLALSSTIEASYPNAEQRWSLVVYKDNGDEYVTRWFDFRDDLQDFRTHLAAQSAGGGGDFPEAPDAALAIMNQLAWRTGDATARLAFWLADAPHHDERAASMTAAIAGAQAAGIHIYPVASSGINDFTELAMRSAAQLTGGRYVFLTDDSGVGGAHKEPSIPCYFVTTLSDAIVRMVDIEMSGVYHEPGAAQVLRTGGNPQDGACGLDSGQTVFVF